MTDEQLYCIGGFNPGYMEHEPDFDTYYPLFKEVPFWFWSLIAATGLCRSSEFRRSLIWGETERLGAGATRILGLNLSICDVSSFMPVGRKDTILA